MDSLVCPICLASLEIPVAAPCGHIHCEGCIIQHIFKSPVGIGLANCPTCRAEFPSQFPDLLSIPERLRPFMNQPLRRVYLSGNSAFDELRRTNARLDAEIRELLAARLQDAESVQRHLALAEAASESQLQAMRAYTNAEAENGRVRSELRSTEQLFIALSAAVRGSSLEGLSPDTQRMATRIRERLAERASRGEIVFPTGRASSLRPRPTGGRAPLEIRVPAESTNVAPRYASQPMRGRQGQNVVGGHAVERNRSPRTQSVAVRGAGRINIRVVNSNAQRGRGYGENRLDGAAPMGTRVPAWAREPAACAIFSMRFRRVQAPPLEA